MLTFNLKARGSGNFYCGHAPGNGSSNCWSDRPHALVLNIEQARKIVAALWGGMNIEIAVLNLPVISEDHLGRELFCIRGGDWYRWPHRERLGKMVGCHHFRSGPRCERCDASWSRSGYWYDSMTGTTINEELVT